MGMKRIIVTLAAAAALFAVGFAAGNAGGKPAATDTNDDSANYPLLARRLFIDNPSDTRINFSPLRTSLNDYYQKNDLDGGIYFEYLPTGTSIRVNTNQTYRAASLIKLPVAMEAYKAQELGKLDLSKKVKLKQEWLNDGFGELYKKGAGYELSLEEAVRIMLVESDNTALRVVLESATDALELKDRALGSLDIEFSIDQQDGLYIGARSYASFLKCLYFACYNTKADSQAILQMLTETDFNERIIAGIGDKSIKVAHKIGVFNTEVQGDCGIVYYPSGNYVLCILLQGNDDATTNGRMADISKIVYDYIANPER